MVDINDYHKQQSRIREIQDTLRHNANGLLDHRGLPITTGIEVLLNIKKLPLGSVDIVSIDQRGYTPHTWKRLAKRVPSLLPDDPNHQLGWARDTQFRRKLVGFVFDPAWEFQTKKCNYYGNRAAGAAALIKSAKAAILRATGRKAPTLISIYDSCLSQERILGVHERVFRLTGV